MGVDLKVLASNFREIRSEFLATFTTPMDLRRLKVPLELDSWNSAVMAFIMAFPEDARIEREER